MKKVLVKLLNLVYIAGAGVSIYAACTKPLVDVSVDIHVSPKQIGEYIAPFLSNSADEASEDAESLRLYYRDGEEEEAETENEGESKKEIKDYITADAIAEAFEPTNGINIKEFGIKIPAKYAFEITNKNIINAVVKDNIDVLIDKALDIVVEPLKQFILNVTQAFAVDALKTAIDNQIIKFIGEDSKLTDEQAEEIYNNIKEILEKDEPVELQELTDVIVGDGSTEGTNALSILNSNPYRICDPQPTEEEVTENLELYYIKNSEGNYVHPETYSSEDTYYKYKEYSQDDIDRVDIESKMTDALSEVPGLVTTELEEAAPSENDFNSTVNSHLYFIYDGSKYVNATEYNPETVYYERIYQECTGDDLKKVEANPIRYYLIDEDGSHYRTAVYDASKTYYKTLDVDGYQACETPSADDFANSFRSNKYYTKSENDYRLAKEYSSSTTYYVYKTTVNDIETALAALIDSYLLGKDGSSSSGSSENGRALARESVTTLSKSSESLRAALKEFADKYIPFDRIDAINASFGSYVPLALLALIALIALPWAFFAFVTIIRTMRNKKCWTKPSIVFVLAFPQVIFGFVLTYGLKYGFPFLAQKIEIVKKISDYISPNLSTSCFIPSLVYLGMLAFTIVYAIIAHPVKVEYRFEKKMKRLEKRARRRER